MNKNDDWKGDGKIMIKVSKADRRSENSRLSAKIGVRKLAEQGLTQSTAGGPWARQTNYDFLSFRFSRGDK